LGGSLLSLGLRKLSYRSSLAQAKYTGKSHFILTITVLVAATSIEFSAPFVYSSKEEEAAARRGWAKGVKVAREVIVNTPLDKDQYTYQVKTVMHHSTNPTSRPTRMDLEDYWGSGIQAIREEDVSSF